MKKMTFIIFAFLGVMIHTDLIAQTTKKPIPSDAVTGYVYEFDAAQKLIIERQVNPTNQNVDVQAIIESKNFPKISDIKKVTDSDLEKLKVWMETNPSIIIETLKSRKEIVHAY
jgi:hypothetical protein